MLFTSHMMFWKVIGALVPEGFYNVKKELLLYSQFTHISQSLYEDKEHPYFGVVSCINMFRAKNCIVIFVGNSQGYIRVYDIQSQKQMKPLFD